jgi:lipopolysaccharide export system protein LptA
MQFARLMQSVSSFLVVLALYWVYTIFAIPLLEPSLEGPSAAGGGGGDVDITVPTERYRKWIAPFFPPGSWELQGAKVLKTPHALLLLRDYRLLEEDRWKIKPCTIIFNYAGQADQSAASVSTSRRRPLVLEAPEGAVLKFDRALNIREGKVGKLEGGWLPGPVTIHSPESEPGAGDWVQITTQNVQISADQLGTPHDVDIRVGESFISGRDLMITLNTPGSRTSGDSLARAFASGVKSVELVHVERMHLKLTGTNPQDGQSGNSAEPDEGPTDMEITCEGPFELDLVQNLASFEKQVALVQFYPDGSTDQLSCQRLTVGFSPRGQLPSETAQGPGTGSRLASLSSWQIDRITAVGEPVVLRSPKRFGLTQCQLLEYASNEPLISDGQDQVAQSAGPRELPAARPDDGAVPVRRIGTLRAIGPGHYVGPEPVDGSSPIEAHWGEQLLLRPQGGEHVLSLTQNAQIRAPDLGRIAASEIHVWIAQAAAQAKRSTSPQATGDQPPSTSQAIQLNRMLAEGQVRFDSSQLSGGATERLEFWIDRDQRSPRGQARGQLSERAGVPAQRSPAESGLLRIGPMQNAGGQGRRFNVQGDRIRVRFVQDQVRFELEDVSVHGQAQLTEIPLVASERATLALAGDLFDLRRASGADLAATVRGNPASIQAQDVTLWGGRIELDRAKGRAWIDGAGRATVPVSNNLIGNSSRPPQPVTVLWQKKMDFDGQRVVFAGGVVARSRDWLVRTEQLILTLNSAVDLLETDRPAGEVKVRYVEGHGHVELESRSYRDRSQLASVDKMDVYDFTADLETGNIRAQGPGSIHSVHRASPLSLAGQRDATAANNPLNCLVVIFQQGIDGNLNHREVLLTGQVEAVYGPVLSWQQQLAINPAEPVAAGTYRMNTDQLTVGQAAAGSVSGAPIQLRAVGNTVVEGNTFIAYAHQMKYSQEKDQLILEWDGRQNVELIQRTGDRQSRIPAQKIIYSDSRKSWKVEGGGVADFETR